MMNTNLGKANGAAVPSSTDAPRSNASGQLTAATSHNLSVPTNCAAASASGTAFTCSTSPAITPAAGDHIECKPDAASTASATLAVNRATAATNKK